MVIDVRRVGPDDWKEIRHVRLAALGDSPDSFWSTYDDEASKPETWWRDRIEAGVWFLAYAGEQPVGIAAAMPAPELEETTWQLISMWVAAEERGRGVGVDLVEAVKTWARSAGLTELQLEVTVTNHAARRLYERCGFVPTGRTQPLPRKPSLIEREMRLRLPSARSTRPYRGA